MFLKFPHPPILTSLTSSAHTAHSVPPLCTLRSWSSGGDCAATTAPVASSTGPHRRSGLHDRPPERRTAPPRAPPPAAPARPPARAAPRAAPPRRAPRAPLRRSPRAPSRRVAPRPPPGRRLRGRFPSTTHRPRRPGSGVSLGLVPRCGLYLAAGAAPCHDVGCSGAAVPPGLCAGRARAGLSSPSARSARVLGVSRRRSARPLSGPLRASGGPVRCRLARLGLTPLVAVRFGARPAVRGSASSLRAGGGPFAARCGSCACLAACRWRPYGPAHRGPGPSGVRVLGGLAPCRPPRTRPAGRVPGLAPVPWLRSVRRAPGAPAAPPVPRGHRRLARLAPPAPPRSALAPPAAAPRRPRSPRLARAPRPPLPPPPLSPLRRTADQSAMTPMTAIVAIASVRPRWSYADSARIQSSSGLTWRW